jgi:glycogen synthase
MKILVISNLYPPFHIGGYELGCADVVDDLRGRGHEVNVLTAAPPDGLPKTVGHVHFRLASSMHWGPMSAAEFVEAIFAREQANHAAFAEIVETTRPDVVYQWNPVHISSTLAVQARRRGLPVAYFVSDDWLATLEAKDRWFVFWETNRRGGLARRAVAAWLARRARRMDLPTSVDEIDFSHTQFCSAFLRQAALNAGRAVADGKVIHWGIGSVAADDPAARAGLVFAGQVEPHKDPLTVIEALAIARENGAVWTLDLFGEGSPAYEATLRARCEELGLTGQVRFRGRVDRAELMTALPGFQAFVLPSVWDEPFSIVLLEGMAAGLATLGTPTGGTPEILHEGETGLLFAAGDAAGLARQLTRLANEDGLAERLGAAARARVTSDFTLERMVGAIEAHLLEIIGEKA